MNTMTRQEVLDRAQELMERERRHLRDASRAQRAAWEAAFIGDDASDVEVHLHIEAASAATREAKICAAEVDDLLGRSAGSSLDSITEGETP